MQSTHSLKMMNAQRARNIYSYKKIQLNLQKANAATYFNTICREKNLTPKCIHNKANWNNVQNKNPKNWQQLNTNLFKKLNFYTWKKIWNNNYVNCIWNVQNTIKCKIYCEFFGYMLWVYANICQMHVAHSFSFFPLFFFVLIV
jgi:hypothetical protein